MRWSGFRAWWVQHRSSASDTTGTNGPVSGKWALFSHWLIWHGRRRCTARNPDCLGCEVQHLSPSAFRPVKPG